MGPAVDLTATRRSIGVDSVILSLRARFDPKAAGDLRAEYELRLDGYRFRAVVDEGRIDLARGASEHADAVIETDARSSWIRWSRASCRSTELVHTGGAIVEGDQAAVERFATLFSAS